MSVDPFNRTTSSAVISPDGVYRYQLRRCWDPELPVCGWVMLNPSTADADTDDPTIRRCVRFARGWGHGGILVVNLFALRTTNPRRLRCHCDPVGDNDRHLAAAVPETETVVRAWGAHPAPVKRAAKVTAIIRRYRGCTEVRCLGITKDGAPRHPQPDSQVLTGPDGDVLVSSAAARWNPATAVMSEQTFGRGRAPRMTFMAWHVSQSTELGANAMAGTGSA